MKIACSASVYDKAGKAVWSYNDEEQQLITIDITEGLTTKNLTVQGPQGFEFHMDLISLNNKVYFGDTTGISQEPSGARTGVITLDEPNGMNYNLRVKDYSSSLTCFIRK